MDTKDNTISNFGCFDMESRDVLSTTATRHGRPKILCWNSETSVVLTFPSLEPAPTSPEPLLGRVAVLDIVKDNQIFTRSIRASLDPRTIGTGWGSSDATWVVYTHTETDRKPSRFKSQQLVILSLLNDVRFAIESPIGWRASNLITKGKTQASLVWLTEHQDETVFIL
jgi:hypothetical protein